MVWVCVCGFVCVCCERMGSFECVEMEVLMRLNGDGMGWVGSRGTASEAGFRRVLCWMRRCDGCCVLCVCVL